MTEAIGSSSGTCDGKGGQNRRVHRPAGDCEAICREGPTLLSVNSTARTSSVASSTARCTLRQVSLVAPLVRATMANPLGAAMLARMPFALAADLDARAVYEQVQRAA